MLKECSEMQILRTDAKDEAVAKQLWEFSEKQIEHLEKKGAIQRALAKKEKAAKQKEPESDKSSPNAAPASSGNEQKQTAGSRRNRKAN